MRKRFYIDGRGLFRGGSAPSTWYEDSWQSEAMTSPDIDSVGGFRSDVLGRTITKNGRWSGSVPEIDAKVFRSFIIWAKVCDVNVAGYLMSTHLY